VWDAAGCPQLVLRGARAVVAAFIEQAHPTGQARGLQNLAHGLRNLGAFGEIVLRIGPAAVTKQRDPVI
jgi:hypothetical protein